ncbi:hypothetical protein BC831DRAFT_110077 [Entophlyctis helioformis]|nr:hypothetical protein BC831DRAFT_110077 [Entophlyctis helioformis]
MRRRHGQHGGSGNDGSAGGRRTSTRGRPLQMQAQTASQAAAQARPSAAITRSVLQFTASAAPPVSPARQPLALLATAAVPRPVQPAAPSAPAPSASRSAAAGRHTHAASHASSTNINGDDDSSSSSSGSRPSSLLPSFMPSTQTASTAVRKSARLSMASAEPSQLDQNHVQHNQRLSKAQLPRSLQDPFAALPVRSAPSMSASTPSSPALLSSSRHLTQAVSNPAADHAPRALHKRRHTTSHVFSKSQTIVSSSRAVPDRRKTAAVAPLVVIPAAIPLSSSTASIASSDETSSFKIPALSRTNSDQPNTPTLPRSTFNPAPASAAANTPAATTRRRYSPALISSEKASRPSQLRRSDTTESASPFSFERALGSGGLSSGGGNSTLSPFPNLLSLEPDFGDDAESGLLFPGGLAAEATTIPQFGMQTPVGRIRPKRHRTEGDSTGGLTGRSSSKRAAGSGAFLALESGLRSASQPHSMAWSPSDETPTHPATAVLPIGLDNLPTFGGGLGADTVDASASVDDVARSMAALTQHPNIMSVLRKSGHGIDIPLSPSYETPAAAKSRASGFLASGHHSGNSPTPVLGELAPAGLGDTVQDPSRISTRGSEIATAGLRQTRHLGMAAALSDTRERTIQASPASKDDTPGLDGDLDLFASPKGPELLVVGSNNQNGSLDLFSDYVHNGNEDADLDDIEDADGTDEDTPQHKGPARSFRVLELEGVARGGSKPARPVPVRHGHTLAIRNLDVDANGTSSNSNGLQHRRQQQLSSVAQRHQPTKADAHRQSQQTLLQSLDTRIMMRASLPCDSVCQCRSPQTGRICCILKPAILIKPARQP